MRMPRRWRRPRRRRARESKAGRAPAHDVREAVLLEELVDDHRVTHIGFNHIIAELRLEALRPSLFMAGA